jgi:hypothetical protein
LGLPRSHPTNGKTPATAILKNTHFTIDSVFFMRTNDHKMSVATIVLILRQHFKYKLEHRFYLGCDINWFCPRSAIKGY